MILQDMQHGLNNKSPRGKFGIVVSGGPAPGINSVIAAVAIEASHHGFATIGFKGGFEGMVLSGSNCGVELDTSEAGHIANSGGSVLGTSRFNPLNDESSRKALVQTLRDVGVDKLVVIGGEGSAYLSHNLSLTLPELRIAHVPKTIDNDLLLPHNYPCFGFETARHAGQHILETLRQDALTTERWFLITTMGRQAGFLALGLGLASGASLTLIPEEFPRGETTPRQIAGLILESMRKRRFSNKNYGIALMAEGILDRLNLASVPELKDIPRDELGRLRYADLELEDVISRELKKLCKEAGLQIRCTTKNIGYELRCHEPISFDIEYTRFLGFGAVRYLLEDKRGIMVVRDFDNLGYITLESMIDDRGFIRSRTVDLNSDLYRVARSFMIR